MQETLISFEVLIFERMRFALVRNLAELFEKHIPMLKIAGFLRNARSMAEQAPLLQLLISVRSAYHSWGYVKGLSLLNYLGM